MNVQIIFRIFQQQTLFAEIYNGTITLQEADKDQIDSLVEILDFRN